MINAEKIKSFLLQRFQNRVLLLEDKNKTFAYRTGDTFGVLIPYNGIEPVKLRFSSASLQDLVIDGEFAGKYLYFSCDDEKYMSQFSQTCVDFLNTENIEKIKLEPLKWWNGWKEFMGNTVSEESVYSTIGELIIYQWLVNKCMRDAVWGGPDASSHDIETTAESYEIKSTIKRYDRIVTISGEHQLEKYNNKPLYLVFLRFELCLNGGYSLDKCVKRISKDEIRNYVQSKLKKKNLEPGTPHYKDEYSLIESCLYLIDDNFPKITMEKLNELITGNYIQSFSYQINLGGLKYVDIKDQINI